MPALPAYTKELLIFIILFSAVIGAYCTTIDYRIRRDLPLITADCFCPSCGHKLALIHQFPVVSWLFLGGRCHYCKSPIPARYPLTEAGFILYYSAVFLICNRFPFLYIFSWFLFVTLFLLLRSGRHFRSLGKGLLIMYAYHTVFAAVLLIVQEALALPVR